MHREIHIRLTDLPADLEESVRRLAQGFQIVSQGKTVQNRGSSYCRMYLTVGLKAVRKKEKKE